MKKALFYIIFLFVSFLHFHYEVNAQKTDTIVHVNGNVLTGDFKKLTYGVVTWKMDGMGTINLEEVKINTIKSQKQFEIKMKNGFIYFGTFDSSAVRSKVNILYQGQRELVNVSDIVEVYPIKRNFWMRTTGKFSLGGNYQKGSNIGTIVFSGNLDYRKRKTFVSFTWDDNNTYQGDSLSNSKADVQIAWQRLFKHMWSSQIATGISQNTELGIQRKVSLAFAGVRDISYNNWNRFYVAAGLVGVRQTPTDDSGDVNDLTGIAQVVWKVYRYTKPKVSVDSNINFQPYITDGGRYSASFNLNPSISVLSDDFKVGVSFYYNFDSKPPTETASNFDYGFNLQLSYALH